MVTLYITYEHHIVHMSPALAGPPREKVEAVALAGPPREEVELVPLESVHCCQMAIAKFLDYTG